MRLTADYDTAPRSVGVGAVVLLHVAVVGGLLQIDAVRDAVSEAAPMFVSLITAEQPKVEAPVPPMPKIVPKKEPPRLITSAATPSSPAEFVAPPAPVEPIAVVPEVVAPPSPPAPAVAWRRQSSLLPSNISGRPVSSTRPCRVGSMSRGVSCCAC